MPVDPTSKSPDPAAEWWTTTDVARYCGVAVSTISGYRRRGLMPQPSETFGRTHLWKPEVIVAWQAERPRPGTGGRPTHRAKGDRSVADSGSADDR